MWRTPLKEPKFEEISLEYKDEGRVAVVAWNRPKKYNPLSFDMFF